MEERIGDTIERMLERNARVEADKVWETSMLRIGAISFITYISVAGLLYIIGVEQFLLSALVPVAGFILATQSLPVLKEWWIRNRDN